MLQYRPVVTQGNQGNSGTCSSALLSCSRFKKTKSFPPSSAANIQVNIYWWRSLVYEWIEPKRRGVQGKREYHVMDGIQAFISERRYHVSRDGTDWINMAAVHCLYKGSTMSIPQLADIAHYSHAHNSSAQTPCAQRVYLPWWVRGVLPIHRFYLILTLLIP